jgi:cytochrome P450
VLPHLARDPLGTCRRARDRYGDVVRLPVLTGGVFLLTHPDHVEQVLVGRNATPNGGGPSRGSVARSTSSRT